MQNVDNNHNFFFYDKGNDGADGNSYSNDKLAPLISTLNRINSFKIVSSLIKLRVQFFGTLCLQLYASCM